MPLNTEQNKKIEALIEKLKELGIATQENLSNRDFIDPKKPGMTANEAVYNIAKALMYAIKDNNIDIFKPAPLTASKNFISAHIDAMDPELIKVFLPVVEMVPDVVPPLLRWIEKPGFPLFKSQFNELIILLSSKKDSSSSLQSVATATAIATEVKAPEQESKTPKQSVQASSFSQEEFADSYAMLTQIEKDLVAKESDLKNLKNEFKIAKDLAEIQNILHERVPNLLNVDGLRKLDDRIIQALQSEKILKEKEELQRELKELEEFAATLYSPDLPRLQDNLKIAARLNLEEKDEKQWKTLSEPKSFVSTLVDGVKLFYHYMTDWEAEDVALTKENFKKDVLLKKVNAAIANTKEKINDCLRSKLEGMDAQLKKAVAKTEELGDVMARIIHEAKAKERETIAAQKKPEPTIEEQLKNSLAKLIDDYLEAIKQKEKNAKPKRVIIKAEGTVGRILAALHKKLPKFITNKESEVTKITRAKALLSTNVVDAAKIVISASSMFTRDKIIRDMRSNAKQIKQIGKRKAKQEEKQRKAARGHQRRR